MGFDLERMSLGGRRFSGVDGKTETSLPYLVELDQGAVQVGDKGSQSVKREGNFTGKRDGF